jgi:tetratricopeptide (TPR) repeat protein
MKHTVICSAISLFALSCAAPLLAHDYTGLIRAEKFTEVERLVNAKLAQDPNNHDALIAKVELILGSGVERIDEAIKLAEQCVASHPKESDCQENLGVAMGTKAMSAGIMSAVGSISKIRDAFKRAVELDPKSLTARFLLLQFYTQTPSFVGGSTSKAKEVLADTAKFNLEAGKLMQGFLELADEQPGKAEAIALAANVGTNEALRDNQREILLSVASDYLKNKKYADSERVFRALQQRFPESEIGSYGLGRCEQEQGKHQAAVALFEKASSITPTPRARVQYRLGVSQQALGEKAKALASYEKALAAKPGLNKKLAEEAQDKIKALKS